MTDSTGSSCPKCGAPIAEDAPQGLCPKCVFAEAATSPVPTSSPAGKTPPPTVEEVAPHFPELEILELIGAGGMGAVYKARQPKLDRLVALKILSHDLAADPAFEERFKREARVLARLNHPNIVTVFDFGTAGPSCFLLMEYVDGVNLRQAMHAGGFTPADTLAVVQDICAALKFAHEEGILHRDIKPENVLIDSRGRVKIADFGIAKLVGEDERDDVTLTMQGAVLGSPRYMAPEQFEIPGEVDQRADIYSLGVVFYELLTGELPMGRFVPPSEKTPMDPRIDEIVMRTLEREREARFQSAGEVKTRVEAITQSEAGAPVQGGGAPRAPGAPAAPAPAPGAARFATASAILTGTSLLLAGVFIALLPYWAGVTNEVDTRSVFSSWQLGVGVLMAAGLLGAGVSALLGIIFGIMALADIRRSNGRKGGYGRAMFGTLTWLVLFVFRLGGILATTLLAWIAGGLATPLVALFSLATGVLAAVFLTRAVSHWARGGTRDARGPGQPGAANAPGENVEALAPSEGPQRGRAAPATSVASPSAESAPPASILETARFANASTILTAIGLLVTGVPLLVFFPVFLNAGMDQAALLTGASLLLLLEAPTALGFIFGVIALRDVRRSGGRKRGFGRAMFGVLTCPVLLIILLSVVSLSIPWPWQEGGGVAPQLLTAAVTLAVSTAAATLLTARAWRWARRVPGGVRIKDHPGAGRAFGPIAAVTALIVLANAVATFFWIPRMEDRRLWNQIEEEALRGDKPAESFDDSGDDNAPQTGPASSRINHPLSALDGVIVSMMNTPNDLVFLNLHGIGEHENYLCFKPVDGGVTMRLPVHSGSRRSMRQAKYVEPIKASADSFGLPLEVVPDTDNGGSVKGVNYVFTVSGEPGDVAGIIRKIVKETFRIEDTDLCSFQYVNMMATLVQRPGVEPMQVSGSALEREHELGTRGYLGESNGNVYLRPETMPLRSPLEWNADIWYAPANELQAEFIDKLRKERAATRIEPK